MSYAPGPYATRTESSCNTLLSSDAWPVSVLNAYKSGASPAHRFEGLDLILGMPARFGMGYAPDGWQNLGEVFSDYNDDALKAAGREPRLIGGADVAAELDAKRAIDQGSRLAAAL